MPGADDVRLLGKAHAACGLIRPQHFLDPLVELSLADRAAEMRTGILVGKEALAASEDSDLHAPDPDDAIVAVGEVAGGADLDLVHVRAPPSAAGTTWRGPAGLGSRRESWRKSRPRFPSP